MEGSVLAEGPISYAQSDYAYRAGDVSKWSA
jgi:hypothetical protein